MGLKEAWRALTKKENGNKPVQSDTTTLHVAESDLFPIVRIPEVQLEDYRKIPLAGIGALGTAFAFLPESARQIVTTRTQQIATKETLFVGVNPKGVLGFLRENQYGTVGSEKVGTFYPIKREECACNHYHENARFQEILRGNKRKSEILRSPFFGLSDWT